MSDKTVTELRIEQYKHIARVGGYFEIKEADDKNNELNRAIIRAFYESNENAYVGNINLKYPMLDELRMGKEVVILKKYENELIHNFEYTFIVPKKDEILELYIKEWNSKIRPIMALEKATERIEEIGGILFIWS